MEMMNSQRIRWFGLLLLVVLASETTGAQEEGKPEPSLSGATKEPSAINKPQQEDAQQLHRFWDKEND